MTFSIKKIKKSKILCSQYFIKLLIQYIFSSNLKEEPYEFSSYSNIPLFLIHPTNSTLILSGSSKYIAQWSSPPAKGCFSSYKTETPLSFSFKVK